METAGYLNYYYVIDIRLRDKIDESAIFTMDKNVDITAITESWMKFSSRN